MVLCNFVNNFLYNSLDRTFSEGVFCLWINLKSPKGILLI